MERKKIINGDERGRRGCVAIWTFESDSQEYFQEEMQFVVRWNIIMKVEYTLEGCKKVQRVTPLAK